MFRAMPVTISLFQPLTRDYPNRSMTYDQRLSLFQYGRPGSILDFPSESLGLFRPPGPAELPFGIRQTIAFPALLACANTPAKGCYPNETGATVIEESRHSSATPACIAPRQRAVALKAYRSTLSAGVSFYRFSQQPVLAYAIPVCLLPDPRLTRRKVRRETLAQVDSTVKRLRRPPAKFPVDFKPETDDHTASPLPIRVDQYGAGAVI